MAESDGEGKLSEKFLNIIPAPDFSRLEKTFRREQPDRVPFYELFSDIEKETLDLLGIESLEIPENISDEKKTEIKLKNHTKYMYNLGYDYINIGRNWDFPKENLALASKDQRSFVTSGTQFISNREEFEAYEWPDLLSLDYSRFETVKELMPDGMKVISLCAGILENVMLLLGHEGISYMMLDDMKLVEETFEAVAVTIINYYDKVASFDSVGALSLSDDMGFKTQTLLSPDTYRKVLFPWYKKLVDVIHSHGKYAILHSCGYLDEVMDDIIDCGWDAKHSFEDQILPVWEAKKKYGDRIALLGGFDMDKICIFSASQVRDHTDFLAKECFPGGGWALGTGNSVADYVPVNNFLTMLDSGYNLKIK